MAAVGLIAGNLVARARPAHVCSDCKAPLPKGAAVCPGCGGAVSGEIRDATQRLEAIERLKAGEPVGRGGARPRLGRRWAALAAACVALCLLGWCTGARPTRLLKPGPTVEVGCENGGFLGTRCAPGDRLGFRVTSAAKPLYLAALVEHRATARRMWIFPGDDGTVPVVGRTGLPTYTLYVSIPELPPGDYRAVATLFSHVPTRAEVEAGRGSALDREEVVLTVTKEFAPGERVVTHGEARRAGPSDSGRPAGGVDPR